MRQRTLLVIVTLMIVTGLAAPAAEASRTPPPNTSPYGMDIFGLGWQWTFPRVEANPRLSGSIRLDMLDNALHQAADAGVRWNRLSTWWCMVEWERGQFFWDDLDAMIQIGRNYGIETVPTLVFTPSWAISGAPPVSECINSNRRNYPPTDMADWANFVRAFVQRYGPAGRNWVHYWEIWNEPDLPEFLSMQNDPGNGTVLVYADLLNTAARVIRAEAPGTTILIGGLSDIWGPGFLDKLLTLTGPRDITNSFDVVSFHAYSVHTWKISLIRESLTKHNLQNRPMWNTELNYLGWDYEQANQGLAGLFRLMTTNHIPRSFWYLATTSRWGPGIFNPRNPEWDPNLPFTPTPFYATFQSQTAPARLPSAPLPVLPKLAAANAGPLRFEWMTSTPGAYPIAGYKLLIDTDLFLGEPRFSQLDLDAWIADGHISYIPWVTTSASGGTVHAVASPSSSRPRTDLFSSYTLTKPLTPGRHYWCVAAVDTQGNVGPYSAPHYFMVPWPFRGFLPLTGSVELPN